MKVTKKTVKSLLEQTFPEYTGKKFSIVACEKVCLCELNWSGGTKNYYRGCTLKNEIVNGGEKLDNLPPWKNHFEGAEVAIPENFILAKHSFFCGNDCGITFYVNPKNIPCFLENQN